MTDASPNVFQRINMAAGYLSETSWYKDGKNSQFSSVTIDQIRREVIKAETLAGLVVTYDELDIGTQEFNGKTYCRIKARLTYVIVSNSGVTSLSVYAFARISHEAVCEREINGKVQITAQEGAQ